MKRAESSLIDRLLGRAKLKQALGEALAAQKRLANQILQLSQVNERLARLEADSAKEIAKLKKGNLNLFNANNAKQLQIEKLLKRLEDFEGEWKETKEFAEHCNPPKPLF